MKEIIRLGTRASPLALYQAELVKAFLNQSRSLLSVEIVKIKTSGDMIRRQKASPFDTKRIFTREIEDALIRGEIDAAVHSAKDLAVVPAEGLGIGAVLEREDPRDCVISREGARLSQLPAGARVGTSSLRRKAQVLRDFPGLRVLELHGNVDSRIRKVERGEFDAVVLAFAGLRRLGLENRVSEILDPERFYPAAGQGVIAVETRLGDREVLDILRPVNHEVTGNQLECERAFLKRLGGGCRLPCGIFTGPGNRTLRIRGGVFSEDGAVRAEAEHEAPLEQADAAGDALAVKVLEAGGREILDRMRHDDGRSKAS